MGRALRPPSTTSTARAGCRHRSCSAAPERATLDLNALTDAGVSLVGRLAAVRDGTALFSGGLRNVFSLADLKQQRLLDGFDAWAAADAGTTPRRASGPSRPGCRSGPGSSST